MSDKLILLVEDNPDHADTTRRALRSANVGNEIVVAEDGRQALGVLFGTEDIAPHAPVLILLDLSLPTMGAPEVLRRIRANERTRDCPVIALAASAGHDDPANCETLGVDGIIRKPVDFERLVEATRGLQLYWVLQESPPPETVSAII